MARLKGECLCGKVKYQYRGKTGNLVHCHCSKCRKWHGAAFRSRVVIEKEGYRWLEGEEYLTQYQSTPNVIKTFCRNCGSSLVTLYPHRPNILGLPIAGCEGRLDNDYREFHIFTDSKADWWQIADDLPQYKQLPEDKTIVHCLIE